MAEIERRDKTPGFGYGVTIVNSGARQFRKLSDDFIGHTLGMKIDERVDFNDLNYEYMRKFMGMNIIEHNTTMSMLGDDAHLFGDSNAITGMAQRPSYVGSANYTDTFASRVAGYEKGGENTTRSAEIPNKQPYKKVTNLYPDDLDSGGFKEKWNVTDKNSILHKTKELFKRHKINTLISRFATSADAGESNVAGNGDIATQFGMSHGRNLLKKAAENADKSAKYNTNGYNNPYCRVWTHHYQYDKLNKLIRPFVDDEGNPVKLSDLHKWGSFTKSDETREYMWKGNDPGWELSSLNKNGFPNITPKYLGGDGKNIHTKDCMFSIENLAWKGYDPYSFEKALSWEQRGPLGGRIMWFPPYGLTFNETTQANWNSNTFIGRGEDVYTYINTVRSGTLSFIMLTDHPSVTDYATWYESDDNDLKDTDILRFFAGCDKDTLINAAKPTPLTDELVQVENNNLEDKKSAPDTTPENEIPDEEGTVEFYVFYPNNYSGVYDRENNVIDPIAYLLFGVNCNINTEISEDNRTVRSEDIKIQFELSGEEETQGYEMSDGSGITKYDKHVSDFIYGSDYPWYINYINHTTNQWPESYKPNLKRQWFYRIDGKYETPKETDGTEIIKNKYDEKLISEANYKDLKGFLLNKNVGSVKETISGLSNGDSSTDNLYTLAEVAAVIANIKKYTNTINKLGIKFDDKGNCISGDDEFKERLTKLMNLFKNRVEDISDIHIKGFSTIHGYEEKNNQLARERANTIGEWLEKYGIKGKKKYETEVDGGINVNENSENTSKTENGAISGDIATRKAKFYRSAKVTIRFTKNKTEKLSDTDNSEIHKNIANNPAGRVLGQMKELYNDILGNSSKWVENEKGVFVKYREKDENNNDIIIEGNAAADRLVYMHNDNKISNNNLRYDQEYHFYKELETKDDAIIRELKKRLKYFDPAFHSMSPEGFNERLTFLNQCTRQGNTITASDNNGTASNLAFGRPPFCVLRIGDFYYQTIVIDSISTSFDVSNGLQWDLNPEGVGIQPMLARIDINFKFIGGGDLGGPIRRLQNAMSFNYYANARLYDNRADRIKYNGSHLEMGGNDSSVNSNSSYAHTVQMANNKN